MSLNIKNKEVEALAQEISAVTGETKTEAIRKALVERKDRLGLPDAHHRIEELFAVLGEIHGTQTFEPVSKEE